jgi:cobalt/nickel transport system permease protein
MGGWGSSRFIDRSVMHLSRFLKNTYVQMDLSAKEGFFQGLDPRLKLFFLVFFAVAISLKRDFESHLLLALVLLIFSLFSRLRLATLYSRIMVLGLAFGVLVSFPSAFNVIVPGTVVFPFITLERDHRLLFYTIPKTIGLTEEGLYLVALLTLRVVNSLTVCTLVLYTTSFFGLIKALRLLRVPAAVILIITLLYKYIFILACSLEETHLAMKSRMVSPFMKNRARLWIADRMAYFYRRTHQTCDEVFGAMVSRGFTGEVRLVGSAPLSRKDWLAGSALLAVWLIIILL